MGDDEEEDLAALGIDDLRRRYRQEREARISAEETLQQVRALQETRTLAAVRRLAEGVAHDFNNLLTLLNFHADQLQRASGGDDLQLSRVEDALIRSARVTQALLAFTTPQMARSDVFDLGSVLSDLSGYVEKSLPESITANVESQSGLWMRGDRGRIRQTLLVLIDNAREAMPDGGNLRIAARTERGAEPGTGLVHVSVTDTGVGMSPDTLRRAFEPFFTTKERSKGGGLGLAVAHGLVHAHQGDIDLSSEPGQGTTARIRFPLVSPPTEQPPASEAERRPRGARIVLAEDDPYVRAALAASLKSLGHEVLQAGDAKSLVQAAMDGKADVLVVDVELPDRTGIEAVRELRTNGIDAPAVFITGHADTSVTKNIANANVLHKPFQLPDLEAAVDRALRRSEPA